MEREAWLSEIIGHTIPENGEELEKERKMEN